MKATAIKFYVRNVYGSAAAIINARQEMARGHGSYGIDWHFQEVTKEEFLKEVEANEKLCCIETKSHKFKEIDTDNIQEFII